MKSPLDSCYLLPQRDDSVIYCYQHVFKRANSPKESYLVLEIKYRISEVKDSSSAVIINEFSATVTASSKEMFYFLSRLYYVLNKKEYKEFIDDVVSQFVDKGMQIVRLEELTKNNLLFPNTFLTPPPSPERPKSTNPVIPLLNRTTNPEATI